MERINNHKGTDRETDFLKGRRDEIKRRVIFYVSFFATFFHIVAHGNKELLVGFLLGSSLCCLFVFEGVEKLLFPGKGNVRRDRSCFFSFSAILVLLLSADYLFFQRTEGNQIGRMDGVLLLFLLLVFLFLEFRNRREPFREGFLEWKKLLGEGKDFKRFLFQVLLIVICISVGSYFLVDGLIGVCIEYHIRFSLAGVLFLPWAVHIVNFIYSREEEAMERMRDAMSFDVVLLYLGSFGLGAVLLPLSISYEIIFSFIMMSVFSILLVWRDKVSERVAGSLMLPMYVAGVAGVLMWM